MSGDLVTARRAPWLLALCSALVQAHGATTSGHLMWFAAIPWGAALMLAADGAPGGAAAKRCFPVGALIGTVSSAHLWGITYYHPAVFLLVIAYHAVVWGAFSAYAGLCLARGGALHAAEVGLGWALLEGMRSVGGFSFPFYFGGTLADETAVVQIASVIGTSGLSGILFWFGFSLAGPFATLFGERRYFHRSTAVSAVVGVALVVAFGAVRLARAPAAKSSLRVSALQGSIPPWLYSLGAGTGPYRRLIEEHYGFFYRDAIATRPPPDLVLFPETTFDWPILKNTAAIRRIATLSATQLDPRTVLMFGATFTEPYNRGSINGVGVASPDEHGLPTLRSVVAKHQLVPLIEMRDRPSDRWQFVNAGHTRVGLMICYESMYPEPALNAARNGAKLLAVLSDDGGMRYAPIAWTHAEQDRLRAIEVGLPLVRAGQAGVSYAVDAYGRVLGRLPSWERGALTRDVPMHDVDTLYRRLGSRWLLVWGVLVVLLHLRRA